MTPDDLAMFLRTLNSEKAASLPVARALSLYVEASRAAGPAGEQLGKELCRAILNSGETRGGAYQRFVSRIRDFWDFFVAG